MARAKCNLECPLRPTQNMTITLNPCKSTQTFTKKKKQKDVVIGFVQFRFSQDVFVHNVHCRSYTWIHIVLLTIVNGDQLE